MRYLAISAIILAAFIGPRTLAAETPPNIVYILCDDLGYGDIQCLNPQRGKIPTPNVDRLAAQGMTFTDAHSGSAVCSPTRYGILTGRYAWRTRLQNGVLNGYSEPLIAANRLTVAALLKKHGYATGAIGKWHVGMDLPKTGGNDPLGGPAVDWSKPILNGPTALGFDYYFGITASLDMTPYIWIENDRFQGEATVKKAFFRPGAAHKDFEAVDVLPTLTKKACEYIERSAAGAKSGKPFFLYLPLNSPHTPIVPTDEWKGKSGLGAYGDFVMQTDWTVGEVTKALDRAGVAENTLIIFTSDNGCSPAAGVQKLEEAGHFASADRRGYKADIWDGGHRVPFIARWPAKVKAGTKSDQVICLTDLMATCAQLVNATLPENAGEDSVSILPALLGTASGPLREAVIHHSISGRFAIRQGNWKLEICPGSGGWASPKDDQATKQGLPAIQLYDMSADIGEQKNLQDKNPEIVEKLTKLLEKYIADGRSTPGAVQKNDVPVELQKQPRKNAKKK